MPIVLYILLLLTEHHGQVIFGGVPVPGATVTVVQGDKTFTAITDQQGFYAFPELAAGPFTIHVEMLGFSTIEREVNGPQGVFELKMLPIEQIHAEIVHATVSDPATAPAGKRRQETGFQRTELNASST